MQRRTLLGLTWLILSIGGLQAEAPLLDYRVIAQYPHPQQGFTQGLIAVDDCVYESSGLYGRSYVAHWCPGEERPTRLKPLPGQYFAEGLVLVEGELVILTWRAGRALRLEPEQFHSRGHWRYRGEGWGLTFDGEHFLMSNGSDRIVRRAKDDFREVGSVAVLDGDQRVERLNELEWVDGRLLANVWQSDRIAVIDPTSGNVEAWLDFSAIGPTRTGNNVLNGIAWDARSKTLLITGKHWPEVYRLRVNGLIEEPKRLPGMQIGTTGAPRN